MSEDKSNLLNIKNFVELIKYINSTHMLTEEKYNALLHMLSVHKYLDERGIYINVKDFSPYSINKKEKVKLEKLAEEIANKIVDYNETQGKLIKSRFDEKMKYKNTLYFVKYENYTLGGTLYFKDDNDDIWEIPASQNSYQHIDKSRMSENRYVDYYTKVSKSLSVYKNHLTTARKYLFEGYIDGLIKDDGYYIANIKVLNESRYDFKIHSVQCKDGIIYKQDLKYNYTLEVSQDTIMSWRKIDRYY
jgi:hypothetical protein